MTGSRDLLWGGLMIFLLTGIAAAAAAAFRGLTPRTAMLAGCLVLLAGLAVTFAAIARPPLPPSWPAPRWPAWVSGWRC